MAITVNEFFGLDPRSGDPIWPPTKTTRNIPAKGDIQLNASTVYVCITCDVPTYWTCDGVAPTPQDNPLVPNGMMHFRVAPLSALTLTFY